MAPGTGVARQVDNDAAGCLKGMVACMCIGGLNVLRCGEEGLAVVMVGLCSFATGQLLDLPFILLDARVTMIYVLMGLKTSLLQGMLSALEALFLFDPLVDRLQRIERNYR